MAEINKLSVGKVIEKLRSNDASNSSKIERLDEKTRALDEEILRALRKNLFGDAYTKQKHAIFARGGLLPRGESARGEAIIFLNTLRFDHLHRE